VASAGLIRLARMTAAQPENTGFRARVAQIRLAFVYTAKRDKAFVPILALVLLGVIAVTAFLVWRWGWWWIPLGVLLAFMGTMIVLNLRITRAMMREAEGQPGAAAVIVQTMRGDWRVTPGVQVTTQNDFVHRVVARPGVILLAEGHPNRVRSLLAQEKKRLARVVGDTPIYDFTIGNGEGQVPIRKLRSTLLRLPPNITAKQVNALDTRLTALHSRPQMPKGPIPKNLRNLRPPKGAYKALRGR